MLWTQSIRPPADPAGKDMTAFLTSDELTVGETWDDGGGGNVASECAGGCFSFSKFRDLSIGEHTDSAELAKRTAPLKSPSSSLADTLAARLLDAIPRFGCSLSGGVIGSACLIHNCLIDY